jgi:hypothetical protein
LNKKTWEEFGESEQKQKGQRSAGLFVFAARVRCYFGEMNLSVKGWLFLAAAVWTMQQVRAFILLVLG